MIRVIGKLDGVRRVYGDGNTYEEAWDQCSQAIYDYQKRRPELEGKWVLEESSDPIGEARLVAREYHT